MNYYMKTTSFNEELAIKSVNIIEIGLALKILIGSFMLSNNALFGSLKDVKDNIFYN